MQEARCGNRRQDVAAGVKMWLQEPRCGCKSQNTSHNFAAGAKKWLQEPRLEIFLTDLYRLAPGVQKILTCPKE